ncbi:cyclin-K [Drosophila takahashii]|uniref:cyclin-K n=1 Tax=Drosophila takahashii TaxID=29030 RepID=UPI001CF8C9CD|nr:AP2-associated protein kinase 1 [Drosophila takahashii]
MGNTPSASQVGRGPSQESDEERVFHGSHRNPERNRSRHCFVIRSQRPKNRVGLLDADTRCCCPPPPLASCCCPAPTPTPPPAIPASKPRQKCCCATLPEPARQRNKPQRCFNNCPGNGNAQQGARRIRACHPDAYPMPELLRTKPMCLHPLGARCNCEDRRVETRRTAAVAPEEPVPFEPEPQAEIPYSDSVRSFQPAARAINEVSQDPHDPYYPYPQRNNTRLQEVDALGTFDLNRFDRDATQRGPGRRRNVSIRTCVDYDYEPEYPPRERARPPPKGPPGYPPPRSRPPPGYAVPSQAYAPRTRPPPPSAQRKYQPRALSDSYENGEIEYVKCPYR